MAAFTIELPNGKRLGVEADDENAAITGAQSWYKQNVTDKTDTSTLGALSQGVSDVATGVGKTLKHYVSPDVGNAVLASKVAASNPKYQSASEAFMRPEDGADNHVMGLDWSQAPRALVEQLPGLAADLAVQKLVPKWAGPIGKYAANALTFGGRNAGSEAEKRAAERTGDPNAEPNAEDKLIGLKSTAEQAALNQVGLNKILNPAKVVGTGMKGVAQAAGNVVKGAAAEGLTNAGQNVISQAEAKQTLDPSQIDGHEALGQGVLGGMGGGIFSAPRGAKDAAAAVKLRDTAPDVHAAMAANRLLDYVSKPKDLEDATTAYRATDAASNAVKGELSDAAKSVTNAHPDTATALDRAQSGEVLTPKELERIDSLGDERLSNLSRQSNELAKLRGRGNFNAGEERFAGGVGEFARKNAKSALFTLAGAGAIPHIIGQGGVGLDTLASGLPGMAEGVAAGLAGYKGLKVLDRMTGASSPARTFAEKFGDGGAVRPDVPLNQRPTGPQVPQQNSVTTPQPWGPVAPKPTAFKPDMLDSNLAKIVDKIQNQKRRDTAQEAMPLLRQLAEQNQPAPAAPGPDVNAMNEQVKSALLMAAARRKIEGQRQAEAEAADSHAINEAGGLDTLRNPAFGQRGSELLKAANVMNRLRAVPEEPAPAPEPPVAPAPAAPVTPGVAQPKNVDVRGAIPTDTNQVPPNTIVGYHGSRDVIDRFDPKKTRLDRGVFFAEDPSLASKFAEGSAVDGDPARIYGEDTPQEIVRWVEDHAGTSEAKRIKAMVDEAEHLDWDKDNDRKSALSNTINRELTNLSGLDQSYGSSNPNITRARLSLGKNHKADMGGRFDWDKERSAIDHALSNGFDSVTFTNTGEKGDYHSILNGNNIHPWSSPMDGAFSQAKAKAANDFVLPESPHVFKEPKEASHAILQEAIAGGKEIRNPEGYRASTQRRLTGEEAIYNTISKELNTVQERGDFHKYLSALWGSDSPEIVTQVREHMLSEFPHHAATINKHLSDEKIKGLWTKPKKAKK